MAQADVSELRDKIKAMYKAAANEPHGRFHFETGRHLARRLGYPAGELDHLPPGAAESFAGVGYHLGLAAITPGERVVDLGSGLDMDLFLADHRDVGQAVPPSPRATARSSSTFAGSWMASGLRHGANTADSAVSRPDARIVAVSSAPPARETAPCLHRRPGPAVQPAGLPTWKVLLELAATGPSATPILPGQEYFSRPYQSAISPGARGGPASVGRVDLRQARALRPRALPRPPRAGP